MGHTVVRNKFPVTAPNGVDKLAKQSWDDAINGMMKQYTQLGQQSKANHANVVPWGQGDIKVVSPYVDWDKKTYVLERYDHDMEVTILMGVFTNKDEAEKFAKTKMYGEYEIYEFTIDAEVVVDEPKE